LAAAVLATCLLGAAPVQAGVSVRTDGGDPAASPFPSDRHTVRDFANRTLRRVNLPRPDCALRPSDCADIDVLNTLDGFSTQPRITIPFTGAIDPATVTSDSVYLVNLGDTFTLRGFGQRVGINQVVWDAASLTLVVQPDALLAEHSRYVLVVTDAVRDITGARIESAGFLAELSRGHDRDSGEYRRDLRDGLRSHGGGHGLGRGRGRGHDGTRIAAASLFTTQSATSDLARIMATLKRTAPGPVNFMAGTDAAGQPARTVFNVAELQGIQWQRQTGTAPSFATSFVPTPALGVVPGAVAQVAYGRYTAPNYQDAGRVIPAVPTLRGVPAAQGTHELGFQLFVPAGPRPTGGWPVVLFGHGFTDSLYGSPWTVASVLASRGLATLSIHVVGHGGGPLGTLTVLRSGQLPVVLNAGGRGIDQNGDGAIDSTEGVNAAPPRSIVGSRDGLRQTVIDLMQLVRQVEAGIDIDADGRADLDAQRLYYAGQSFGGIYGTLLLGVEPALKAGVPNVPGGSITEVARLGAFRPLVGIALATRVPPLINVAHPSGIVFDENLPLRDEPPRLNTVPGAMAIARVLDWQQWAQQAGNPVSYAPLIRKAPLPGQAAKPVIFQFAKGDGTVPNPTTSAILRAGELADRATYFRNDLAFAADPGVAKNPHTFLTNIGSSSGVAYAVGAQSQMAVFFASGGTQVIDPDGPAPFFEVPVVPPLPEALNFLP
jgi:hypothetical protein